MVLQRLGQMVDQPWGRRCAGCVGSLGNKELTGGCGDREVTGLNTSRGLTIFCKIEPQRFMGIPPELWPLRIGLIGFLVSFG